MKKVLFASGILLLATGACKKGSDTPSENKTPYIGKWTYDYGVNWHMWIGTLKKDTTLAHPGEYIEFKADGTVTECNYYNGSLDYTTLKYQVNNNILFCKGFPDSSKIIVSGNTLIIDASDPSNSESLWWHYKR